MIHIAMDCPTGIELIKILMPFIFVNKINSNLKRPNQISIYDIITEQTLEERDEMEFRVQCAKREYNEVQIWEDFRKRNEKQNDLYRDILKAEYKGYQPKQYYHDYIHEKNYRPKERDF